MEQSYIIQSLKTHLPLTCPAQPQASWSPVSQPLGPGLQRCGVTVAWPLAAAETVQARLWVSTGPALGRWQGTP